MNLFASVILFCALPLLVMLIARIATRSGWLMVIGGLLLLSGAATAGIWAARPVTGLVLGKSENLEIAARGVNPGITRRLVLIVAEDQAIEPTPQSQRRAVETTATHRLAVLMQSRGTLQCAVGERLFDSVREGDRIPLHMVKWGPVSFAWPATEPWWNAGAERLQRLLPSWGVRPQVTGQAQIDSVRTVREADVFMWGATSANRLAHFPLPQPYDEARLRFVTPGGAQILTLDRVDAGSAGALSPGSSVTIDYPVARPRMARLSIGTRSYAWRNARNYWVDVALAAVIGIALLGVAEAARRWVGRRLTP